MPESGLWLADYPFVDRSSFLSISLNIEETRQAEQAAEEGRATDSWDQTQQQQQQQERPVAAEGYDGRDAYGSGYGSGQQQSRWGRENSRSQETFMDNGSEEPSGW